MSKKENQCKVYIAFIWYYQNVSKKKFNDYTILRIPSPSINDAKKIVEKKRAEIGEELFLKYNIVSMNATLERKSTPVGSTYKWTGNEEKVPS